jgi:polyvinyl alcohol dehydrogenase (cytochrome)
MRSRHNRRSRIPLSLLAIVLAPAALSGQIMTPRTLPSAEATARDLYGSSCARCHTETGDERTPSRQVLGDLSPRAIVYALTDGVMATEGEDLTPGQRIALAEYLSGRAFDEAALPESAFCDGAGFGPLPLDTAAPQGASPGARRVVWKGFGGGLSGTGYQPADRAGLDATDVPRLELLWAFAFPGASQVRTKPTVVGDVAIVGGPFGEVLALDAATGCVRWEYRADAGIRGAVEVGTGPDGRTLAHFVDFRTNAYGLDVATGELVWKTRVGWHPTSNATGSPILHDGALIVPISSMEVVTAGDPRYECCTASGAVASLDAGTGDVRWYHRVIPGYPDSLGVNAVGATVRGPAGAPVWSSPTVDSVRGVVYVGTGENYTRPATDQSDAVLALDLGSGELVWSFQATTGDAFTMACMSPQNRENCPAPPGPDLDFGMAPMRVTRPDGREILVVGQKSGMVFALDPDADGAVLWSTRVGKGGALGGIHWGMAADDRHAYATVSDRDAVIVDVAPDHDPSPGLYALDLTTGEVTWSAPAPTDTCARRPVCYAAYSAAPTVIDGAVFTGGLDGRMRAYASTDGRLLWEVDTVREFAASETASGLPGRGGAIDGPGPVVAGGRVFVNSGYGTFTQMPGNMLLVYALRDR